MGLIQLFTNPAGWAADKVKDKIQDKVQDKFKSIPSGIKSNVSGIGKGIGSNVKELGSFGNAGDKFKAMSERITSGLSGKQEQAAGLMEGALSGGDTRQALIQRLGEISERELPVVDEFKPAGKAAEWMNRLGAGLFAASGGNPEAIYANFRNKEMAKQAKHQRQTESRQMAIEKRDTDIIAGLSDLDQRQTVTKAGFANSLMDQESALTNLAAEAGMNAIAAESEKDKLVFQMRDDWAQLQQNHVNRMTEMDHSGKLAIDQIEYAAGINIRNETNAELTTYGVNPASFDSTIRKYAAGDFDGMDQQDHVRMQMIAKMRKATTDMELRAAKMDTVVRMVGTTVHARDRHTGAYLYEGEDGTTPIYTNLSTTEAAMSYIFGDPQMGLDAIGSNPFDREKKAIEEFTSQAGMIDPGSGMEQGLQRPRSMGGFPGTEDASFEGVPGGAGDAGTQLNNIGPIWDQAMYNLQDKGESMLTVVSAMEQGGLAPEVLESVINQALATGLWDGEEDKTQIQQIITVGSNVNAWNQ